MADGPAQTGRAVGLPALWQKAQRVRQGASPSRVVHREDQVRLLHYTTDVAPQHDTPLIFVFALVNRPYILDLTPQKSVVGHFVRAGFDTYLVDWGVPTQADRHRTLEDYVDGYLVNLVDHVRQRTGRDQVSLLGYCMGGTMSAMFAALHPDRVKNLILLAAGIDYETREGLLNLWTDPAVFDVDRFVDMFGNCPAPFLQSSFVMLKPVQNLLVKPMTFVERMHDEKYVDDYLTMETWLNDNIPVPGEVFRQFVKDLYQRNLLVKDQLRIGRRVVRMKDIVCPVLNLMATADDLVPSAQSQPFTDLVGSQDRRTIQFPAGHIGLAVGSKAQRDLWPKVVDWLAAHD